MRGKYHIEQWDKPAYVDLCQQPYRLDSDTVQALGLEVVLLMGEVRERYRYRLGLAEGYNKRWGNQVTPSDRRQIAEEEVVEVFFPHLKPAAAVPSAESNAS